MKFYERLKEKKAYCKKKKIGKEGRKKKKARKRKKKYDKENKKTKRCTSSQLELLSKSVDAFTQ